MDNRNGLAEKEGGFRRPRVSEEESRVIIKRQRIVRESMELSRPSSPWGLNRSAARFGLVVLVADRDVGMRLRVVVQMKDG